jgi:hypothetical protein
MSEYHRLPSFRCPSLCRPRPSEQQMLLVVLLADYLRQQNRFSAIVMSHVSANHEACLRCRLRPSVSRSAHYPTCMACTVGYTDPSIPKPIASVSRVSLSRVISTYRISLAHSRVPESSNATRVGRQVLKTTVTQRVVSTMVVLGTHRVACD